MLQIVVSGVASSPAEVSTYASCTMLAASMAGEGAEEEEDSSSIHACIDFLQNREFITLRTVTNAGKSKANLYCKARPLSS